jgi:hypothetical protein
VEEHLNVVLPSTLCCIHLPKVDCWQRRPGLDRDDGPWWYWDSVVFVDTCDDVTEKDESNNIAWVEVLPYYWRPGLDIIKGRSHKNDPYFCRWSFNRLWRICCGSDSVAPPAVDSRNRASALPKYSLAVSSSPLLWD